MSAVSVAATAEFPNFGNGFTFAPVGEYNLKCQISRARVAQHPNQFSTLGKLMRLWVDDLRPAPEGWVWAKTSQEALRLISSPGHDPVDVMSLDHDLGGDDTTRPIILWLCVNPQFWPKKVAVHSANPVGVEWLKGMIDRYMPRQPTPLEAM